MPPKRKAASDLPGGFATKRLTPSTAPAIEPPSTEIRLLRCSDKPDDAIIMVTTPQRPRNIITYAKRSSTRRGNYSADSLKENEKQEEVEGSGEKSSDDELDMLSPTKLVTKRESKPSPMESLDLPAPSLVTRSRSGRLLQKIDTPVRRQSKRFQSRSALEPAPLPSTPTGKMRIELPEPVHAAQTSARATRSSASSGKEPEATSSKLTPSPKKKPLTATKDKNTNQRAERLDSPDAEDNTLPVLDAPSLRKQRRRGSQENADDLSKKAKSSVESSPEGARASSRASAGMFPSPGPLKFDSVMIPPLAKNRRPTPPSATALPGRIISLPREPSSPLSPVEVPPPVTSYVSPSKNVTTVSSPARLPRELPHHLYTCLNAQKRAILRALRHPPDFDEDDDSDGNEGKEPPTNSVAAQQLTNLLSGTVLRGEGNSCVVLGPRGSGKSQLVEQCIAGVSADNPLILRLSGWTQHTDRLAMRELAYQLSQQTGTSFLPHVDDGSSDDATADPSGEGENPFLDASASSKMSPLPSAHLPALISVLPTLNRPSIVILDGFDLFALHPRQSLLYCLLDTAQSCRATGNKGLAIIGITSRIDTITTLEKRVKSRFSGRMFRAAPPRRILAWKNLTRAVLSSEINDFMGDHPQVKEEVAEWQGLWDVGVNQFLSDQAVQTVLNETFSVTRDVRMLNRILLSVVLRLSPASPCLSPSQFLSAAVAQRARPCFPLLHVLPYPHICLLIASIHADTGGQTTFTFEILHEYFRDQVRASTSAPVQVNGGSIGMVRCSRQILMTAFEDLISTKVFVATAAYMPSVAKDFIKYRSAVDRESVKRAVDKMNQVNLKKWLTRAR